MIPVSGEQTGTLVQTYHRRCGGENPFLTVGSGRLLLEKPSRRLVRPELNVVSPVEYNSHSPGNDCVKTWFGSAAGLHD